MVNTRRKKKAIMAQKKMAPLPAPFTRHSKHIFVDEQSKAVVAGWERLKSHGRTHKRQFLESLSKLRKNLLGNSLIILMLGITLAMPLTFYVTFQNAFLLSRSFDPLPKATVFLKHEVSHEQAQALARQWQNTAGVASVEVISREQGLGDFLQYAGLSKELIASLDDNPLPEVINLSLAQSLQQEAHESAQLLREKLLQEPLVDQVELDVLWVKRLSSFLTLLKQAALFLAWALGFAVVLVIANTIRLAIENCRQEIKVAKLVGANNAFIRRPFVYLGVLYGGLGALAAITIVKVAGWLVGIPLNTLLKSYALESLFAPLSLETSLLVVLLGMLLGALGAFIATHQQIAQMEPS